MSTETCNLKTYSSALCIAVVLFAVLKGSLCLDLESDTENNYFTVADILAPFRSCQIKLMMLSRHFPTLALQMILELTGSWMPYESLYDIPNLRVHHYARRYRDHCSVRIAFSPSPRIQVWAAGSPSDRSISRINREKEIVIFMAEDRRGLGASFEYHKWLCLQPLNIIALLYKDTGNGRIWIDQAVVILQRCNGGPHPCPVDDGFLLGKKGQESPMETYNDVMRHFQKLRSDFQGMRLHYYNAQDNYHLVDTKAFETLEAFRYSHPPNVILTAFQVPIILGQRLNFTLTSYRHTIVKVNLVETYCQIGGFTQWDSFVQADATEGTSMNICFQEFSYFKAIYTADDGDALSPIPFKLKSLVLPADPVIWVLLLLTILMISVLFAVKVRAEDVVGVAFAVMSPLTGQTFSGGDTNKVESELKFWYSCWLLLSLLFGIKYGNFVQSLTTFPKGTSGTLTFRELMEKNFTLGEVSGIDFSMVQQSRYVSMGFGLSRRSEIAPSSQLGLEQVLAERLREHRSGMLRMRYVQNFYSQVHAMGIVHKTNLDLSIPLMAKVAGRSIHTTKDELFRMPEWWLFQFLPNVDVLTRKFGWVRQSGLEGYWTNLRVKAVKAQAEMTNEGSLVGEIRNGRLKLVTKFEGTLADSMIRESFCLLTYGVALSLLVNVLELCFRSNLVTVEVYVGDG